MLRDRYNALRTAVDELSAAPLHSARAQGAIVLGLLIETIGELIDSIEALERKVKP